MASIRIDCQTRVTYTLSGNLHLNVVAKHGYRPELQAALEPFIYELVGAF